MKFFICILFLSVLCGLHAFDYNQAAFNQTTFDFSDAEKDEHRDKILDLLNVSSYHLIEIDDELNANEDLVRVQRAPHKLMKVGCERDLALGSTFGGGGVGAIGGAAAGAAIGSVVPVLGTAVGAFTGILFRYSIFKLDNFIF